MGGWLVTGENDLQLSFTRAHCQYRNNYKISHETKLNALLAGALWWCSTVFGIVG